MSDPSDAPLMLGVSGLRGIVGQSLTPEVAARFAGAFGAWLKDHDARRPAGRAQGPFVVVGADGRAGHRPIRDAAAHGLSASGCRPTLVGISMTPTIAVVADDQDAAGGLVVTASHNPQEWNGLKCLVRSERGPGVVSACAPGPAAAAEIIGRFRTSRAGAATQAPVREADPRRYEDALHVMRIHAPLAEHWDSVRARRFSVVLDSVNGAGRFAGKGLLAEALACDLMHLGADEGGMFPHAPEPTRENLSSLRASVRDQRGDIAFAQDPDADRLAIVDERGEYSGEEYTLALAAESLLGGASPPRGDDLVLVTNLSTSRMIDDVAARYGARVVRTPVGEANVVEAMKREKAAGHNV